MKRALITVILAFSFVFSPLLTSTVHAAEGNLFVSGIITPPDANGIYTFAGTRGDGYNYWSLAGASGTTYYIYNDPFNNIRYWDLDDDLDDTTVLFYSSSSSEAASPLELSWTADQGVGSLVVTGESGPEIAIWGNGVSIASGSTAISSATFTNIGSASTSGGTATRTFTIKNTGIATLTLSGASPYVTLSGTGASNFSVTQAPSQSIAASSGTTTFAITFSPTSEGYKDASVTIGSNDADEGTFTFAIQGYGYVARSLVVSGITEPSAANGTYLHQGTLTNFQYWKHQSLNYYIYSSVYQSTNYWSIDNDTDGSKVLFFVNTENGTPIGLTGWKADTTVSPTPTGTPVVASANPAPEIGVKGNNTSITINDNSPSYSDFTRFGTADLSSPSGSVTRTYSIENSGDANLSISGITLGGTDASSFSKTDPGSMTVAASGSTTFTVTFDPATEGTKTATVTIASNDSDEGAFVFTISGDAFSPKNLRVSGITIPYAANGRYIYQGILNQYPYWKHESQNYYIFNNLYSNSYYWNIDSNLDDTDDNYLFYKTSDGASPVGFTDWSFNNKVGYITAGTPILVYDGPDMEIKGNSVSIATGSTAPSTADHTDFGPVGAASGTEARTFTIYNTGSSVLHLTGTPAVSLSGPQAGDFTLSSAPDTSIAATTGSTTFTITFDPSDAGTRSVLISIANDDSDKNPYTFTVQGTGLVPPTLTTSEASTILTQGATLGGNVSADGGATVTGRGVVYSQTDSTPTIGEAGVTQDANGSGTGPFSEAIGSMAQGAHYYFQAYATNSQGTAYGGVKEFTTLNQVSAISLSGSSPTNAASVSWEIDFAAPLTGLTTANFTLANTGLTDPIITGVSGSGSSWTVTASTGTGSGTLGLNLTSATGLDAGLTNIPFTGDVYTLDKTSPSITAIARHTPSASPTNADTLVFRVTFSEEVTGVDAADFSPSGTTAAATGVTAVSASVYQVTLSGGDLSSLNGVVGLDLSSSPTIQDGVGNPVSAGAPSTDETYTLDNTSPTVTIDQAADQADPTSSSPIHFTVVFSKAVTGFGSDDVTLSGTAGATTAAVTGSDTTYSVAVSGMTANGTVIARIPAGAAADSVSNLNTASTSTDATVAYVGIVPAASTNAAGNVTSSSAVLHGTVNAYNDTTAVTFEYWQGSNPATSVAASPSSVTGSGDSAVSYVLTGLTPNTTYRFRVTGVNAAGTTHGSDLSFTTLAELPSVTTRSVSAVTVTGAVVNGAVSAKNDSTTVTFEYGLTTAYGATVTPAQSPVTGLAETAVTYSLSGLTPNTRYHYRVVGQNSAGTAYGGDRTFTTLPLDVVIATEIQNASNLVVSSAALLDSLHASATVVGNGPTDPVGTVTFTAFDNPSCSGEGTEAGTISLASSVAEPSQSAVLMNNGLSFRAHYNGDGGYPAADGACVSISTSAYPTVLLMGDNTLPKNNTILTQGPNGLQIPFSLDMLHGSPTHPDSVENPANYLLVEAGPNRAIDTQSCGPSETGGLQADDVRITVDAIHYDPDTFIARLDIHDGKALPDGSYRLFICGTTSIIDQTSTTYLNNHESDSTLTFTVSAPKPSGSGDPADLLPATGFAPNVRTDIPAQPLEQRYADTSLWLEIPALQIQRQIVGVPGPDWGVTWLGNQIGYLQGTAFPTWSGNSVLTGHVTDANGKAGPFAHLDGLRYGDPVIIHAWGQDYVYEVRTVDLTTSPSAVSILSKHEDLPWLTLITCRGYDEKTGAYRYRTVVRAVLVRVK